MTKEKLALWIWDTHKFYTEPEDIIIHHENDDEILYSVEGFIGIYLK